MSFEDLIKLKEKLGSRLYNETVFGKKDRVESKVKQEFKRENKNRPREMSAKRPVPLLGNEIFKSKIKQEAATIRDPRFDPNCGEFDANKFKENFGFVADIKEKELVELKCRVKESSDPKEIKKLKYLIQRMQNQNLEETKRKAREKLMDDEKQEIKKAKMDMKMPQYSTSSNFIGNDLQMIRKFWFLFSGERKARELVQQYTELKNSGKLNKHLEKRRKKNAARDRKKISFD